MRRYKRVVRLIQEHTAPLQLARWQKKQEQILRSGADGYRLQVGELGLAAQELALVRQKLQESSLVILGEIDQQGRLLSYFGPVPNFRMVERGQFEPRKRFTVRLVALDGIVGIEKSYEGRPSNFLNELLMLYRLGNAHCRVPAILGVDFDKKSLTTSFIRGRVLRDALEARGARLNTNELVDASLVSQMNKSMLLLLRSDEGKRLLPEVLDASTSELLFDELMQMHAAGVIGNDIKYGNVIIEEDSGEPYWIDFDHAFCYPNFQLPSFRPVRDRDIEKFNTFFGTSHFSYRRLQKIISTERAGKGITWQVPVYFGSGLALGSLWDTESGFGSWECFIKHHMPRLSGKRILDLYANNAFYSLQMARRLARVVALEPSAQYLAQAKLVQKGIEWADNTRYPIEYISTPISELSNDAASFDIITAFGGISGVDHAAAAQLVQHLGTLGDMFVLYRGFAMPDGTLMTTQECARILRENGFPATGIADAGRNGWRLFIGSKQ